MDANFFIIDAGVYPFDIMISLHDNYKSLKSELKQILPKENHKEISLFKNIGNFDARTVNFKNGSTCIFFKKHSFLRENLGIITHEVIHVVNFLFTRMGITYAMDNDEHFAYLAQFLFDKIIEGYDKINECNTGLH